MVSKSLRTHKATQALNSINSEALNDTIPAGTTSLLISTPFISTL